MDTSVIIALIFGIASIASSIFFGLIPTIRRSKIEKLETKTQRLLKDIKLLYEIEDELLVRLEKYGCNKKTTKEVVRKTILDKHPGYSLSEEVKPSVYNKQIID